MPYSFHFHGKFHAFDEAGNEASIPYDQILDVIYNSDYDGYIVSEYEGRETPAFPFVKQHLELERRILAGFEQMKNTNGD